MTTYVICLCILLHVKFFLYVTLLLSCTNFISPNSLSYSSNQDFQALVMFWQHFNLKSGLILSLAFLG